MSMMGIENVRFCDIFFTCPLFVPPVFDYPVCSGIYLYRTKNIDLHDT